MNYNMLQLRGDELVVNVFVNYEKYDSKGNLIDIHLSKDQNGLASNDSEEEEEEIDYEKDDVEEDTNFKHRYVVDFVAKQND